ncbi:MAG: hypothetical protein QF404_05300 [Planctomycetota bacterium]|jgi:hypothetical protein|nr:hypothetical protein [Planctomycetota bacterium]MDP6939312.1 hypothetical protein [Planctomycetota bacterium]
MGGLMVACVAPQPSPKQVAGISLGDPQSTFEAFITAHQGGLLGVEYECFSMRLRRKHGLSQHAYREFRDQLLEQEPNLTWALYRARIDELQPLGPRHVHLKAHVDLPALVNLFQDELLIEVDLVLEDRYEVLAGNRTLAAQGGPPEEFDLRASGILALSEDGRLLTARIPLSEPIEGGRLGELTSVEVYSRWRIDGLKVGSVQIE